MHFLDPLLCLIMEFCQADEHQYLNFQKLSISKIMASGPITSWQIEGETVEAVTNFIFLGSKFTADGDCSHEIKRYLLLGRKAMTKLDSMLKIETSLYRQKSI